MQKILVVDNSALMRKILCDIINSDSDFQVTDMSLNGEDAYNKIKKQRYDLVVMEMLLPQMDGITLLEKLHEEGIRVKVIAISTAIKEDAQETMRALELGACDFVKRPARIHGSSDKFVHTLLQVMHNALDSAAPQETMRGASGNALPRGRMRNASDNAPLRGSLRSASETKAQQTGREASDEAALRELALDTAKKNAEIISKRTRNLQKRGVTASVNAGADRPTATASRTAESRQSAEARPIAETRKNVDAQQTAETSSNSKVQQAAARKSGAFTTPEIVALACSTGGPQALLIMLPMLPATLRVPVVLVQHMPAGFTTALAERLDSVCALRVKEAEHGEILRAGCVYIAPGGKHLEIIKNANQEACANISDEPPVNSLRPCADIMYASLEKTTYQNILCVVLTGMGADGTKGISGLRKKKNIYVISESQETCVVYGMPRSIQQNGLADEVVPIEKISEAIVKKVGD